MMKAFVYMLILFLYANSVCWAEIYQYVDEKGRVVFTEIPPTKDAKKYKLSNTSGIVNSRQEVNAASESSFEQQKKYLDYLTQERLERKEKLEQKKMDKAELRAECNSLKAELEDLSYNGSRYYELDSEGNREVVDYEVIQQRKDNIKEFIKNNCSNV